MNQKINESQTNETEDANKQSVEGMPEKKYKTLDNVEHGGPPVIQLNQSVSGPHWQVSDQM